MEFALIKEDRSVQVYSVDNIPLHYFYTYLLVDPDNGVFYVGKGRDNRMINTCYHEGGSEKGKIIDDILSRGKKVQCYIVSFHYRDVDAYDMEYRLILKYKDCIVNKQIFRRPCNKYNYAHIRKEYLI
jgi:hypothetical protein